MNNETMIDHAAARNDKIVCKMNGINVYHVKGTKNTHVIILLIWDM